MPAVRLRTVVADDEPLALEYISTLLGRHAAIELVARAVNGHEALKAVMEWSPDLLVLDIEMPGMNAFEVIQALQSDEMPLVVFSSAYDQYALDAFELHAVDYVLKPLDPARLETAIDRAVDRFVKDRTISDKGALLEVAVAAGRVGSVGELGDQALDAPDLRRKERLVVRDGQEMTLVNLDDIDWVDAAGDYMCLHVAGKIQIMRSTMKQLMERLPETRFARIHRSTIVNLDKILRAETLPKGEFQIFLDDEVSLKVSRNYRNSIASLLK